MTATLMHATGKILNVSTSEYVGHGRDFGYEGGDYFRLSSLTLPQQRIIILSAGGISLGDVRLVLACIGETETNCRYFLMFGQQKCSDA